MKKFFFWVGAFFLFFFLYWRLVASEDVIRPSELGLIIAIGFFALVAFIGVLNSAPRAWKEIKFCCRRRQSRLKSRRQGATTVVLN